jgi:hypothetical protein
MYRITNIISMMMQMRITGTTFAAFFSLPSAKSEVKSGLEGSVR